MSVDEYVPFILPPPPENFRVDTAGQVIPLESPPAGPEWLEGRIKHFSASSLRLLRVCPEAYRQRYILGRKERPGEALTMGTAVHDTLGRFDMGHKLLTGENRKPKEIVEHFHDVSWPETVEKDGGVDEIRWDNKPDDVRRDGERVAQAYHATVSPRLVPVREPEMRFDLYIDDVPVPFIGYLDVEEEANVVDWKTGKQVTRKPDANWRMQGAIYSLAKQKATHFHSMSRAKTPSIATPLESPEMAIPYRDDIAAVTRTVLREYAGQVEHYMTTIGPDDPWPITGIVHDYKGGPACQYCGFRKTCPAWAWERTVP